ncbi:MAG: endonuclease domain-containing protein [Patescibacteria group bacterium]|jgi:very-short-patch-repair endonuclease
MTLIYNPSWSIERRKELRMRATFAEIVLWNLLRNRQLMNVKFRRQYGVDGYIVDFYAAQLKFAIELDGAVHDTEEARRYDQIRDEHLRGIGIEILRLRNEEVVLGQESALKRITEAMRSRQARYPSLPRRG